MPRWLALLALMLGVVQVAAAQDTTLAPRLQPVATLTLAEAVQQAQQNSPTYRQTLNNAGPARWAVRNAYGQLLPQVEVSGGMSYTGSGQSQFGAFFNQTSPFWGSNYQLGLQWQLSGTALTGPAQQRALERATQQDIEGADVGLRFDVTSQYFTVAAAAAQTDLISMSMAIPAVVVAKRYCCRTELTSLFAILRLGFPLDR